MEVVEACKRLQDQLAHATNEYEREDLQESLEFAQAQIPAHDKLIASIESTLVDSRAAIKAYFGNFG